MIVPDTNVISEVMASNGRAAVQDWFKKQPPDVFRLATPVLAELLAGLNSLPVGRRRDALVARLTELIEEQFSRPLLVFDEPAARAYANLVANARGAGRTVAAFDGQIAAIALVHGASVATRDVRPFVDAGVEVINPWEQG